MTIVLIIFFSILIISFITGVILTKQEAKKNNIVSVSQSSNSEEIIQPESSLYNDVSDDNQSNVSETIEQEVPQSILNFIKDSDIECLTLYPENEEDSALDVSGIGDEQPYIFSNYIEPSKQVYDSSEIEKIVEEANAYSGMMTDNSQNITNQSEYSISDLEENSIQTDSFPDNM